MNISIDPKDSKFTSYLRSSNWTLCLGAGICNKMLPNWSELTRRVVNECFGLAWDRSKFDGETSRIGFSLDGWLQASLNALFQQGKTEIEFYSILEKCLYSDLIALAEKEGKGLILSILLNKPSHLNKEQLLWVCGFFERNFPNSTLLQLVRVLIDPADDIVLPQAIITFNADPLLYALIFVFSVQADYKHTGEYNFHYQKYVQVIRSFEIGSAKIPIYHLHGAIFTNPPKGKTKNKIDSRDNLVFAESSYIRIAGSMHSWAQNTFLYYATTSRMVFVGLSMSDPNIRRWLSWVADDHRTQLKGYNGNTSAVLRHLWIKPRPSHHEVKKVLEESLLHLSTKLAWIDNWNELEPNLLRLMGRHM